MKSSPVITAEGFVRKTVITSTQMGRERKWWEADNWSSTAKSYLKVKVFSGPSVLYLLFCPLSSIQQCVSKNPMPCRPIYLTVSICMFDPQIFSLSLFLFFVFEEIEINGSSKAVENNLDYRSHNSNSLRVLVTNGLLSKFEFLYVPHPVVDSGTIWRTMHGVFSSMI